MAITISGTSGVTYPAGGTDNVAGAGVGTTDTQTLTNKTLTSPTLNTATINSFTAPNLTEQSTVGFKNRIINGDMRVAQRAAPVITASPQYGKADRFIGYVSGGTSITGYIDQSADSNFQSGYRLWLSSLTYTTGTWVAQQRIESMNTVDLNGKTVTLSFKVWHDFGSSRAVSVTLAKANSADNFASVTSIGTFTSSAVASGTYTTITCSFTLGSTDASNGLLVQIADSSATSVSAKNVLLGDIQLEKGSTATSFDCRPYGTELALCQRYYEIGSFVSAVMINTGGIYPTFPFKVTKRAAAASCTVTNNRSLTLTVINDAASSGYATSLYQNSNDSVSSVTYFTVSAEL